MSVLSDASVGGYHTVDLLREDSLVLVVVGAVGEAEARELREGLREGLSEEGEARGGADALGTPGVDSGFQRGAVAPGDASRVTALLMPPIAPLLSP